MRRIICAVAGLAVVLTGGVAAGAGAPTPTPLLPAGSHAAFYNQLTALAGSAGYLAYAKSNSQPGGGADLDTSTLWIRKADGTRYQLSPTAHVPEPYGVSMVGSILVVSGPGQSADWYDLANDTHGTPAPATTNGSVAAASNDGWLTVSPRPSGGDEVFDTSTSGTVTSDGVPFPSSTTYTELLPGPAGVIADAGGDNAYMKYSNPGTWTPLTAISHDANCTDLSATDAACVRYRDIGDDDETVPADILQVPLDGSPVVTTTPDCAGAEPRLSATAIVWQCGGHVYSVPLGGGPVSESSITVPLGTQLESAQGTVDFALDPTDGPATMYAVTAASQPFDSLFVTTRSAVEASQLAVTSGRVVWQDDRDRRLPVSVRSVARSANVEIDLGTESHVFASANLVHLAASGARTIVNTSGSRIRESSLLGDQRIPATGPLSEAFLNEQPLSGNRYLFARSAGRFNEFVVRDLGSRRDRVIASPDKAPIVSAALWGDEVAFVDERAGVWVRNLATGKARRVKAPRPKTGNISAFVSVYRHEVGWDILRFDRGTGHFHFHARARNVHTMAPATKLSVHDAIAQASSDGFVIRHFPGPSRPVIFTGDPSNTATWELMAYHGAGRQVLAARGATQVTVDNGVAVYLDAHHQPQVAAISHPTASAPVSLGDPIAPKRFTDAKRNRWTTYQAFSRPLASCAIVIRRSGSRVARLRCDSNVMRTGDAYVQWDGRNTSGKRVHAGVYRWRIRAGNAKGAVRSPGGRALHGVLTVSR